MKKNDIVVINQETGEITPVSLFLEEIEDAYDALEAYLLKNAFMLGTITED